MKFSMVSGDVLKLECGALVVGIPAGGLTPTAEALDKASEGAVSRWIEAGDIHPCVGKVAIFRDFPGCKAERVVFVGLGKCKARDFQRVLKLGIDNAYLGKEVVLTTLEWLPDEVPEWIAEQSGFIACTALDRPKNYKTFDINWKKPKNIDLYVPDENKDVEKAYAEGVSVGVGVQMAKQYGDMPANLCTPKFMAEECMKLAGSLGLDVTVFDEKAMEKLGMGCLLGVAKGSHQKPRMVVIEYHGGKKDDTPVALVGKGLTFDSGGISLKPAKGMDEMKYDMCGAAAMIASIATAAAMKLPVNIVAAVGFTENMPGSSATKPGDILKSYAGKTVEVLNTDAEGRLVLCDVLAYTIDKFKPKCVVDVATLTGACVVALGNDIAGLFSNDEELAVSLMMAGDTAMDPVWRMPLDISFTKALKSNFADLANISDSRGAGACTAAAFLEEFVGDTPWAHLDIAGVANKSGKEKGSTGRPVPLLINFLKDQAE